MIIEVATINDLSNYNDIYQEFVMEQTKFLGHDKQDILKVYQEFDFLSRNRLFLSSEYCLIQIIKNNNEIIGFLESNLAGPDMLFEKQYIYISNLYFKKEYRVGTFCLYWGGKMLAQVEQWAENKNIKYICNDVSKGNHIMEHINKFFGFETYKTRYLKKL